VADAPASLQTALADRYRIERQIGAGGMATVFLAHDVRHDRKVAVKVLRPELAAVLGAERFLNEIRITAKLDHPHILTLIDSGSVEGLLFYVLPFVRGESLRDRLDQERQLGLEEALGVTRQVALALDYAHRQGVIHRDIKPENILLHEGEAIVADFGIALAMREAGGSRLTETGLSLGTPQYMSPEQATGDRQVDQRSDIYSLAAVLYEMLAGEPPVNGPTVQAVIAKLLTERPTRLRTVRDTVPASVDAAVAKALAKVPADRYPTAADFAAALVVTPEPEPQGRRSAVWTAALLAGGAVLVAGAIWATLTFGPRAETAPAVRDVPRIQVTFTGAASAPALSPDGQRMAFAERACGLGHCTHSLVVQDIGGAGSARLVEGYPGIYEIEWSPDSRFIKFTGTRPDGRYGDFLVPALGGATPRFLTANATDFLGNDSLLMTAWSAGESLWIGIAAATDARVRDTVRLVIPGLHLAGVEPSPDGRWLAGAGAPVTGGPPRVVVVDRRTVSVLDSVVLPPGADLVGWRPDGTGLVIAVPDSANPDFVRIEQRAVGRDGRLSTRRDVLLPGQRMLGGSVSAGGIAYATGAVEEAVFAASRPDRQSGDFDTREVTRSTGALRSTISPDGRYLSIAERVGAGGGGAWRLGLEPFDGGARVGVSEAIPGFRDLAWSPGNLFYLARDRDRARVVRVDPVTGKGQDVGAIRDSMPRYIVVLRNGELAWPSGESAVTVRLGAPGGASRDVPVGMFLLGLRASPFDDGLMAWGWSVPDGDSLLAVRVDPAGGRVTRLAAGVFEGAVGYHWLTPELIEVVMLETVQNSGLYHLHVPTGRFERITGMPLDQVAFVSFSDDGRRLAIRTEEVRSDIWLARVFDPPVR
jgi:dipeptidyl aminopeptidase/acylaminoacyl peptidase